MAQQQHPNTESVLRAHPAAMAAGAIGFTILAIAAIAFFYGQHQPNDSMFGILYFFVPLFTLPFGAFLGQLASHWGKRNLGLPTGYSQRGMFVLGALCTAPTFGAVYFSYYTNHLDLAPGWSANLAGATLAGAVAAWLGFAVSGRRAVATAAVLLSLAVVPVYGFAHDAAETTSEQRRNDGLVTLASQIDTLLVVPPTPEWTMRDIELSQFHEPKGGLLGGPPRPGGL